jgi:hypothetical protein
MYPAAARLNLSIVPESKEMFGDITIRRLIFPGFVAGLAVFVDES